MVDEFPQAQVLDEGGRQEQAGIGHQAVVVKDDADTVRIVLRHIYWVLLVSGRGIEFTRSRAYRKNDQAWIEQKNGSVVRRFAGHDRYSGQIAGQTMVHLYKAVRLHVNYFQPSFKLLEKIRDGARVIKRYTARQPRHATWSCSMMRSAPQ